MVRNPWGGVINAFHLCLLLLVAPCPAAAATPEGALLPPDHMLAPGVRERLLAAAADPALAPWQREFEARLAQGSGGSWIELQGPPSQ